MQQQPGSPSSLKGGVMSRGACEVSAGVRGTSAGVRGHRGGLTGADLWARRDDTSGRYELAPRSTEGAQVSKEETGRLVVCGV